MDFYYYVALAVITSQVLFLLQSYNNYRYTLQKYKKKRLRYRPRTVLIVPCKGLEANFQKNIRSFFTQDYENYSLWFVVSDTEDAAYVQLCRLREKLSRTSKVSDVRILVAGQGCYCSQKLHNLLYCYERIDNDVEILAFADSDICVHRNWLSHLVYPLRQQKNGVASGYRWFVPKKNNPASLALSALNSKVAQLLGNTRLNQAWGGSMAIRAETFRQLNVDKLWARSVSDDLSLSSAVKKAGLKVAFVPACLVASYESTDWRKLFEFGRRQFLITRVTSPRLWWFGLLSCLYSVSGLYGGTFLAVYAATKESVNLPVFAAVPILFFAAQFLRAAMRQRMIRRLLKEDIDKLKFTAIIDMLFFWVWSLLLLVLMVSSMFGRTICWRGIRYKLVSPTETIVIKN
ncbi:MAG: glycosyltransferase family 2 protein [Sedimentisphaerales bacterium]|nr:glycosyltransferase family 2 protein [Sedimentisphaerales bacterium]